MARDVEAHHFYSMTSLHPTTDAERIMSTILTFPFFPQAFSKARKPDSY